MDDILKRYIDKVLEIQEKKNTLTDNELREIAREIGLSEQDLLAVDQNIENCEQRAKGFMAHSIWSQAIPEWEHILILSPNRQNARASLAYCYLHQGDNKRAQLLAEAALKTEPSNTLAFEVLGAIQQANPKNNLTTMYLVAAGFICLVVVGGVAAGMYFIASSDGISSGEAVNQMVYSPLVDSMQPQAPVNRVAPTRSKTVQKNVSLFPISADLPPGLELDTHISKYDVYGDKSYYKLRGKIRNLTRSEISELKGTFTYTLKDGNSVQDVIDIIATHEAPARPSDSADFSELHKFSNASLKSVALKVDIIASSKAVASYPKSKKVPYVWAEGLASENRQIEIFERTRSLSKSSSFGQFLRVTWEFKNLGPTVRKLKMQARYLSKENKLLAEKTFYVTYSGSVPIEPKEVRIKNTIQKFEAGTFDHYELSVIEID